MKKFLISVVLPTYNRAHLLPDAVASILNQTFTDFELIIVDDGSDTENAEAIQKIVALDSRIQIIKQKNAGRSAAKNTGIRQACGRYIAFMDDDDISLSHRLQKQLEFLESNVDFVSVDCQLCDGKENNTDEGNQLIKYQPIMPPLENFLDKEKRVIGGNASSMVRHSALKSVGSYREWFSVLEDADLSLRLQERYPMAKLADKLYRVQRVAQCRAGDNPYENDYFFAAVYSSYCRRNGKLDFIESTPNIEYLHLDFQLMPTYLRQALIWESRGLARHLLRKKRYREVREMLVRRHQLCKNNDDWKMLKRLKRRLLLHSIQHGKFAYWFK